MRLEPILRAHRYMWIQRPPELWEADTEDSRLLQLLGETIAAALASGAPLDQLTLNVSNVIVEPPEPGDEPMAPQPADYVAITVSGSCDLGPDDTWHPAAPCRRGLLFKFHALFVAARARFAYVRRVPAGGSLTVLFLRFAACAQGATDVLGTAV